MPERKNNSASDEREGRKKGNEAASQLRKRAPHNRDAVMASVRGSFDFSVEAGEPLKKGRACNETKSEEKKKAWLKGWGGQPEDEREANEWHTASGESGQLLYNNKGHVGRKRDGERMREGFLCS